MKKTFVASAGLVLISSTAPFSAQAFGRSPFDGYNPFANPKTDLRKSIFGKNVLVTGKIYDSKGTTPLSNVEVEVWHLSANSSKYRHRAKLMTNAFGEYRFITDYPNKEEGKMTRIYFKLSKNSKSKFTELLFNDYDAHITGTHWENNKVLNQEMVFPIMKKTINTIKINFNITL